MNDRESRSFRIEQLKRNIKKENSFGSLFNECLDVLGTGTRIYSQEKSQEIVSKMVDIFIFTKWSRVNWKLYPNKMTIRKPSELSMYKIDLNQNYFVIWNEYNLPVIETTIGSILNNFDDIIAVGFDTWIINFDEGIIVENYHEGEITIGKKNI